MLNNKYRVYEATKDPKKNSKGITDILTRYVTIPKNHTQILGDRELSLILEYLTRHDQVGSIESIYAKAYQEPEAVPAPRGRPVRATPQAQRPAAPAGRSMLQQPQNKPQPVRQLTNQPTTRIPEEKVVDTHKGGQVNLGKHDEWLESLAVGKTKQVQASKQKLQGRNRHEGDFQGSKHRQGEQERMHRLQLKIAKRIPLTVKIPNAIGVDELISHVKETDTEVVETLMKGGAMTPLSDIIDFDIAVIIAEELDCRVEKEVIVTIEEWPTNTVKDKEEDLEPRAPVVVVMGHVDHDGASLPDCVHNIHVTAGEVDGITQHIGTHQVNVRGKTVTFLNTPGHEAFTTMRARGVMITDVVILVVVTDDSIMPRTVESISHAKAANVLIIATTNKMDKSEANPGHIKEQLTKYELVPEEWGGETIICSISAKTDEDIDNLLGMVNLTAEMQEPKANPDRSAHGAVVEARLDRGRSPVATLLVQNGALKQGGVIIAGTAMGRVRAMTSAKGEKLTRAGPPVPVEIIDIGEIPDADDDFHIVTDERMAHELVEQHKHEQKIAASTPVDRVNLENLFSRVKQGEIEDLGTIVETDVQGSAGAVKVSLERLSNREVRVRIIHCVVGTVSESDVMPATTSNAIIVGLNVCPNNNARGSTARNNVDMRAYRIIYSCINKIETVMKGMLASEFRRVEPDQVETRNVFRITGIGMVAGCYITDGRMWYDAQVRLLRDNIIIYDGVIASLRRFRDSVKEVAQSYECGITFEKFQNIREGDMIEAYLME